MKRISRKLGKARCILLLLTPAAFIISQLAHLLPNLTETVYSRRIYPLLTACFGRLFGLFPFSVSELLLYATVVSVVGYLLLIVLSFFKDRARSLKRLSNLLAALSLVYFVFIAFCGINYARPGYASLVGLSVESHAPQELGEVCGWLIDETNQSRDRLDLTDAGYAFRELSRTAGDIFISAGDSDYLFSGYTPAAKPVIFSQIMSHLNITGIYSPFTFEGNINTHPPNFGTPATMLHELAHYNGFMSEDDANFISYLLGSSSGDARFEYSSNFLALSHALSAYRKIVPEEAYLVLLETVSPKVLADFKANNDYWQSYSTPVARASDRINDKYLKANHQTSGVQSYGQVTDLIIAYYQQKVVTNTP